MNRRELIMLLGGASVARPLAVSAQQQTGTMRRRIGVLNTLLADDPHGKERIGAFLLGLQQAGWTNGGNIQVDQRWAVGDADAMRKFGAELVALAPDVILALQLHFILPSESMGDHDSEDRGWREPRSRRRLSFGRLRCGM